MNLADLCLFIGLALGLGYGFLFGYAVGCARASLIAWTHAHERPAYGSEAAGADGYAVDTAQPQDAERKKHQ